MALHTNFDSYILRYKINKDFSSGDVVFGNPKTPQPNTLIFKKNKAPLWVKTTALLDFKNILKPASYRDYWAVGFRKQYEENQPCWLASPTNLNKLVFIKPFRFDSEGAIIYLLNNLWQFHLRDIVLNHIVLDVKEQEENYT